MCSEVFCSVRDVCEMGWVCCGITGGVPQHSEGPGKPDHSPKGGGSLGLPVPGLAVVPEKENGDNGSGSSSIGCNFVAPPQIVIEVTGPGSPQSSSRGGSGSGSLSPDAAQLEQALESRLGGFTIVVTGEDDEPQHLQEDGDCGERETGDGKGGGEIVEVISEHIKEEEEEEERKGDLTVQQADLDDHDHDSGILC